MTYLNCAATSIERPASVAEAVVAALGSGGSSSRGAGAADLMAARSVALARERIALLLGFSHPERVVFGANATMALNQAILGAVHPGDHVVATDWSHNSVLRPLYRMRDHRAVRVDVVRSDTRGRLDMDQLEDLVTPGTRLLVATHASNLTGNVCDLAAMADIAHRVGALLLVDAAQTAGARTLCMDELGIDLLAFTGHKALMGPQGTGGLLVQPSVQLEAVLRGGTGVRSYEEVQPATYPEHLEAGTLNGPGIAGLSAAVAYLAEVGVDTVCAHDLALTKRFVAGVRQVPGATVYGDYPDDLAMLCTHGPAQLEHAPVVTLNLAGWHSSELADALETDYGISVRAGAHCAPLMHEALGTRVQGAVRFSFGWYTTEEDVDVALAALHDLAGEADNAPA